MFPNEERIIKLREKIYHALDPLIDNDYCLLDIPDHANIGDQLICKGELAYLKRLNYKLTYSCSKKFFDAKKIQAHNVILFHGGGNFGDFYRGFQNFRIEVIQKFPHNKIIIFPQTVYYKNSGAIEQDAKIFNQHPNLTIGARDTATYNLLSRHFVNNKILLLPDMAFCLNLNTYISSKRLNKTLILKRTDKEISSDFNLQNIKSQVSANSKIEVKDWPPLHLGLRIVNSLNRRISKKISKLPLLCQLLNDRYGLIYGDLSEWYLKRGIEFINEYDEVYTTRLHGYILSILLNKKVNVIDNSYGKNSHFYNTWMSEFVNSKLLNSYDEK